MLQADLFYPVYKNSRSLPRELGDTSKVSVLWFAAPTPSVYIEVGSLAIGALTPAVCRDLAQQILEAADKAEKAAQPKANVMIRFKCGAESRLSEEFGPFPFVQMTYNSLRTGPDGETFAVFYPESQEWRLLSTAHEDQSEKKPVWWSDFVVYTKD